jgi:nucleoside-diphosphate-sugar epimerase
MANKRILLIGASGFIGTCLSEKLRDKATYETTLLVRKMPKTPISGVNYVVADILKRDAALKYITGFDVVINTAAIIRTCNKKKYSENVIMMENIISALNGNKVCKLIHFSTQNVNLKNKGYYSKSKEDAEKILQRTNLDYLILRPNYVYSIDKNNDFYSMARLISHFNVAIVIGTGNKKIQPILREDLADIVLSIIENSPKENILELSGSKTVSINEIVKEISYNLGKAPKVIHIPVIFLSWFRFLLPFDLYSLVEDTISAKFFKSHKFSSFYDDLKRICELVH